MSIRGLDKQNRYNKRQGSSRKLFSKEQLQALVYENNQIIIEEDS